MLVLRTVATFYPHVTGPAYQAYRIAKGLVERGHRSPLVTTSVVPESEDPGYPPDMSPGDEFPFPVRRHRSLGSLDQYRIVPQAILDPLRYDPDVVHAHGYHNSIKDLFYLANVLQDVPFVLHTHGSMGKSEDPTLTRRQRFQYRLYDAIVGRTAFEADAVVVSSPHEKEDALEFGLGEEQIRVIGVGKDPEVFAPDLDSRVDEETPTVLFVGRLAPRRNLEALIDAVAQLPPGSVEVRIVGDEGSLTGSDAGYVPDLERRAEERGVSGAITFTGSKYGDDLVGEYQSADLYVNPSHYENFGQATLEAAFCGLPVLSTPTGVAVDLVDEGATGYIFEDATELAGHLEALVDDPELRSDLGGAARQRAVANYAWDAIVDQYLKLYRELL